MQCDFCLLKPINWYARTDAAFDGYRQKRRDIVAVYVGNSLQLIFLRQVCHVVDFREERFIPVIFAQCGVNKASSGPQTLRRSEYGQPCKRSVDYRVR